MNEFETKLKEAQEVGARMMASKSEASRAHSIAMNNLETSQLWAAEDSREKGRISSLTKSEDS